MRLSRCHRGAFLLFPTSRKPTRPLLKHLEVQTPHHAPERFTASLTESDTHPRGEYIISAVHHTIPFPHGTRGGERASKVTVGSPAARSGGHSPPRQPDHWLGKRALCLAAERTQLCQSERDVSGRLRRGRLLDSKTMAKSEFTATVSHVISGRLRGRGVGQPKSTSLHLHKSQPLTSLPLALSPAPCHRSPAIAIAHPRHPRHPIFTVVLYGYCDAVSPTPVPLQSPHPVPSRDEYRILFPPNELSSLLTVSQVGHRKCSSQSPLLRGRGQSLSSAPRAQAVGLRPNRVPALHTTASGRSGVGGGCGGCQ